MPRIVVDVSPDVHLWLSEQCGDWKPRTAVLRELIADAMHRLADEKQGAQPHPVNHHSV